MSDKPRSTVDIELTNPFELTHSLTEAMRVFREIGTRKELVRSDEYLAEADEVERVTYGMAYGRPATAAPQSDGSFLRIAAWNVERGRQLSGIKHYIENHPQLREVDILLLPEVDVGMGRSGNAHVAREIAETLGFEWVFGNSYLCLSQGNLRDGRPVEANSTSLHGNAILSRYPLKRAENVSLHITKDKFHSSEKRLGHKKALWAEVDTPLGRLAVAVVHLDSGTSPVRRALQLEDLLFKLRERGHGECAVVGGDFNTTTYDLQSVPRLLWNLLQKFGRGGVAHVIHHYREPYLLYEKPIFGLLDHFGFDHKSFNAPGVGTMRYEVDSFASESAVRDYLPQLAVWALQKGLASWNGVAPLKMDWIMATGMRALTESEVKGEAGRSSLSPRSWAKPRWAGKLLSDHDPVMADMVFLPASVAPV